jgi:hypothetical protein
MPTFPPRPILAVRQELLDGMARYMSSKGKGCGYAQGDIDRCAAVVDRYLANLGKGASLPAKEILDEIKQAVLDLNALNENCGGSLIETDQREALCEIILVAAKKAGLDSKDDATEEWREW